MHTGAAAGDPDAGGGGWVLAALDVILGFVGVILLLSVFVTAGAQFTQALARCRARNLRWGLERLIAAVCGMEREQAKKEALRVLDADELRPEQRDATTAGAAKAPKKEPLKLRALLGPRRSWMTEEDVRAALQAVCERRAGGSRNLDDAAVAAEVDRLYPNLEREMSRRFAYWMRIVSVAWAFLVAAYFQVSTPDLLARLSREPERARQASAQARAALLELEPESFAGDYRRAAPAAVEELRKRHPEIASALEGVPGGGESPRELLAELSEALKDHQDERPRVLAEYARLLDEAVQAGSELAAEKAREDLAGLEIRAWPGDWGFYFDHEEDKDSGKKKFSKVRGKNLVGVLMTAVLLSLGAPTWFEMLKRVAALRDVLAPPPRKKEAQDKEPEDG